MPFASEKEIHSAYALGFLSTHPWDELEPYLGGEGTRAVERDLGGTITLNPTERTFTIEFAITTNISSWNWALPGNACQKRACSLGENTFWMQQYPSNNGGVGRTVIEFSTKNVITAVFKTNVDNFGTSGSGSWTAASRAE